MGGTPPCWRLSAYVNCQMVAAAHAKAMTTSVLAQNPPVGEDDRGVSPQGWGPGPAGAGVPPANPATQDLPSVRRPEMPSAHAPRHPTSRQREGE